MDDQQRELPRFGGIQPRPELARRHQYMPPAPPRSQPSEAQQSQLLEYWSMLRGQIWIVLLVATAGGLAGYGMAKLQRPMFRARTTLDIQGQNENFLNIQELVPTGAGGFSPEYLQTEIKLLQSSSMLKLAIDKLKTQGEMGTRIRSGRLAGLLGLGAPKLSREELLNQVASSIQVRALGVTRVVEVTCESEDSRLASDFCNTLAQEYIQQNLESRWQLTQHTGEWLRRQLASLRDRLAQSEQQLQNSARDSALLVSDTETLGQERLRQLQAELSRAQAERISKQSQYEVAQSGRPDALPEILDNASLREYRSRITDLRRQLAELGTNMTPAHYKYREVEAQLKELETAEKRERENVLGRTRSEYESAQRREALLTNSYNSQVTLVSGQAGKGVRYNMLKREVDSGRKIYETMLQRVEEVGLASAMRVSSIRVVDRAAVPVAPFTPNPARSSVIGVLMSSCLALGVVFFRARSDQSLQQPGDAAAHLSIRELGAIPSARFDPFQALFGKRRQANLSILGAEEAGGSEKLELTTWHRSSSIMAESFCATMSSILFAGQNGWPADVLLLTSADVGDGKTTVSSNLAIAMTQVKRRVVLIDWDMRHPRLHEVFGVEKGWGLADMLSDDIDVDQVPESCFARPTLVPTLYLVTAGDESKFSPRLLHSKRAGQFVRRLRREFDVVIIDSPPILPFSDARVIARLTDGVLLVLRAGKTTREIAMAAAQCFVDDGTPLLGTVLNDWSPTRSSKYGAYRKYYQAYGNSGGAR